MTTLSEILAKLADLKPELKRRYKVREIGLFGSWVRAEQHTTSDIDILVEFEEEADLFDWIGLTLYLEENLGYPVDVVPRKALRPELQPAVLEQVVRICLWPEREQVSDERRHGDDLHQWTTG